MSYTYLLRDTTPHVDGYYALWGATVGLNEWKAKNSKSKGYAHFDERTNVYKAWNYIKEPSNISKHGFYPLIRQKIIFNKYNKGTGVKTKVREIAYSSHIDRLILSYYNLMLNHLYNEVAQIKNINDSVIAYRDIHGKSNIEFSKIAFDFIKRNNQAVILVGDFTDFFGSLDHKYLKEKMIEVMGLKLLAEDYYAIYKYVTRYSYCEIEDLLRLNGLSNDQNGRLQLRNSDRALTFKMFKEHKKEVIKKHDKKFGIPQGTAISALLSNIYMIDFDESVTEYVKSLDGLYMRYSDDFIIILPNRKIMDAKEDYEYINQIITETPRLLLQDDKTQIYEYKKNSIKNMNAKLFGESAERKEKDIVDYLGFTFDGKNVRFRDKTITKYYYKMYRKTRTIIRSGGRSSRGNRISNTELYKRYSIRGVQGKYKNEVNEPKKIRNFISYVLRAEKVYFDEPEISKLRKRHMSKIRQQLKKIE